MAISLAPTLFVLDSERSRQGLPIATPPLALFKR